MGDNWIEYSTTRQRLRKRMIVSMKRWKVAKLRMGIRKWLEYCQLIKLNEVEEDRKQLIAKKIISRIMNRQLAFRFDQWIDKLHEKRKLKKLLLRVKNNQLHGWFDAWNQKIEMLQHQ